MKEAQNRSPETSGDPDVQKGREPTASFRKALGHRKTGFQVPGFAVPSCPRAHLLVPTRWDRVAPWECQVLELRSGVREK